MLNARYVQMLGLWIPTPEVLEFLRKQVAIEIQLGR